MGEASVAAAAIATPVSEPVALPPPPSSPLHPSSGTSESPPVSPAADATRKGNGDSNPLQAAKRFTQRRMSQMRESPSKLSPLDKLDVSQKTMQIPLVPLKALATALVAGAVVGVARGVRRRVTRGGARGSEEEHVADVTVSAGLAGAKPITKEDELLDTINSTRKTVTEQQTAAASSTTIAASRTSVSTVAATPSASTASNEQAAVELLQRLQSAASGGGQKVSPDALRESIQEIAKELQSELASLSSEISSIKEEVRKASQVVLLCSALSFNCITSSSSLPTLLPFQISISLHATFVCGVAPTAI